jgi:hypothetical protein
VKPEGQAVEMVFQTDAATTRRIDRLPRRLVDYHRLTVEEQHLVC